MIQSLARNPAALIKRGAPHRIHDDATLARYTQALFRLTAKPAPDRAERETIDLLTLLIEDYETRYRMPGVPALDLLKYLMEKGALRQQDLREELGSASSASMILSGRRNLTLANAAALSSRFNMDIRAFLSIPTSKPARSRVRRSKLAQPAARLAPPAAPRRRAA